MATLADVTPRYSSQIRTVLGLLAWTALSGCASAPPAPAREPVRLDVVSRADSTLPKDLRTWLLDPRARTPRPGDPLPTPVKARLEQARGPISDREHPFKAARPDSKGRDQQIVTWAASAGRVVVVYDVAGWAPTRYVTIFSTDTSSAMPLWGAAADGVVTDMASLRVAVMKRMVRESARDPLLFDAPIATATATVALYRSQLFSAEGLVVTTITVAEAGGSWRIDTISGADPSRRQTVVRRSGSARTVYWRSSTQRFTIVESSAGASEPFTRAPDTGANRAALCRPEARVVSVTSATLREWPVTVHTMATAALCGREAGKRTARRYSQRTSLAATASLPPAIDRALRRTSASVSMGASAWDASTVPATVLSAAFARDASWRELAQVDEAHRALVSSVQGTRVRATSVTLADDGVDVPFRKQERHAKTSTPMLGGAYYGRSMGEAAAVVGVTAGISLLLNAVIPVQHAGIPAWVTDVDPDFAAHGGSARMIEFLDAHDEDSRQLFDVPSEYSFSPPSDYFRSF